MGLSSSCSSFVIALPLYWIAFYDVAADVMKVFLILFSRYIHSGDLALIINGSLSFTINLIISYL